MGKYLLVILIGLTGLTVFGLEANAKGVSGEITCFYEIYSKATWPKSKKTESFTLDIGKGQDISTSSEFLKETIRMRYQPGYRNNKISYFIFSLTYDGAHAGADIPMTEELSSVYLSRDGSDLIGGFLNCQAKLD